MVLDVCRVLGIHLACVVPLPVFGLPNGKQAVVCTVDPVKMPNACAINDAVDVVEMVDLLGDFPGNL
eukprot:1444207-Prorocentrum_lima.AAC.1